MNSPKFMLGVMLGSLVFAFVMINLWIWNMVPIETMREFNSKPEHVYLMIGIALATMFGGGFLCATIFDKGKR